MDQSKLFKCCLPQILLATFLNTLSHIFLGISGNIKSINVTHFSGGIEKDYWYEIG